MRRSFALLVLAAQIFRPPCSQARTLRASGMEISKDAIGSPGGSAFAAPDGSATMAYALAQQGGVGSMTQGTFSLGGGIYSQVGAGGLSGAAPLASLALTGGNCPDPASRISQGVLMGLPVYKSLCLGFNQPMLPGTLSSALQVLLIRDKDGNLLNVPTAVQTQYQSSPNLLIVSPTVAWSSNTVFGLTLSTQAADQSGQALAGATTFQYSTPADPIALNTFQAPSDPQTRLDLAANALPQAGYVEIGPPAASMNPVIATANAKMRLNDGAKSQVIGTRELQYFDAQSQPGSLSFSPGAATLSIPYPDANGDGIIDGTSPPAKVSRTSIYYLDEAKALWIKLPNSSKGQGNTITASVPHLSIYALISPQSTSLSDAYAFPSPFRPRGPTAGNGPGQTGTEAGGITFANLPDPATVEVYNVRGELVWRGQDASGSGQLVWSVRNSAGQTVASGVYLYVIRNSSGENKTGKLVIIR